MPPRCDAPGARRRVRPVDDRRAAPRRAPDDADRRVRSFFFFFLTFSLSFLFLSQLAFFFLFSPSEDNTKNQSQTTGKRPLRRCSLGQRPYWLTTRRRNGESWKRSIPFSLLLLLLPRARSPPATQESSPFWNPSSSSLCGCSRRRTS